MARWTYSCSFHCPANGFWCTAYWYADDPSDQEGPGQLELEADEEPQAAGYDEAAQWCEKHSPRRFDSVHDAEEWLRDVCRDADLELW